MLGVLEPNFDLSRSSGTHFRFIIHVVQNYQCEYTINVSKLNNKKFMVKFIENQYSVFRYSKFAAFCPDFLSPATLHSPMQTDSQAPVSETMRR